VSTNWTISLIDQLACKSIVILYYIDIILLYYKVKVII